MDEFSIINYLVILKYSLKKKKQDILFGFAFPLSAVRMINLGPWHLSLVVTSELSSTVMRVEMGGQLTYSL